MVTRMIWSDTWYESRERRRTIIKLKSTPPPRTSSERKRERYKTTDLYAEEEVGYFFSVISKIL